MRQYNLSQRAEEDLYDIYLYTIRNFNVKQAENYLSQLYKTFELITENPKIGRPADDTAPGYRRHICQKHIVFYLIKDGDIFISRVIHHSEDSENYNL